MKYRHLLIACLAAAPVLGLHAHSQAASESPAWRPEELKRYEFGQSRAPLLQAEESVRQALNTPAQQAVMEKRLIELLQSEATVECKRFVCRQLYLVGSSQAVPVLASLLTDPALADMARYALERIPGPAVDTALRQALSQTQGRQKVGVVYSLGQRGDSLAVPGLIECLANADDAVARAAIAALEKVGGQTSVRALQEALSTASPARRPLLVDALLTWGAQLSAQGEKARADDIFRQFYQPSETQAVRMAALRGLVTLDPNNSFPLLLALLSSETDPLRPIAADHFRHWPGTELTRRAIAELPRLPTTAQALLLAALGDARDPAALPAAVAATQSSEAKVRVAALQAIGSLGGADQVPLLANFVASEQADQRAAAQANLNRLRGNAVDTRIIECLKQRDPKTQNELIRCLEARVARTAVPALLEIARAAEPALRERTHKALGALAQLGDLPALVQLATRAQPAAELAAAEDAIATACSHQPDKAKCVDIILAEYSAAPIPARAALLRLLGTLGHERGLAVVRKALSDDEPQLQDAALRVLAAWPSPEPADDLLRLAQQTDIPTRRALAIRGFIAMAGLPSLSNQERLGRYQRALAENLRPEEVKLVLGGLAAVPSPEAFRLAQKHLAEPAARAEAAAAMIRIAEALKGRSADTVAPGLQAILASGVEANLKTQAQKILNTLRPGPAPNR
ncbi:MAG: HEAT repeat domain-containing protein [Verrucomicrobia bacterium]|nr:HEAT repeat domain-containing protein [Verrucomicrobiota bacterium]